jgi:hypothetical protein
VPNRERRHSEPWRCATWVDIREMVGYRYVETDVHGTADGVAVAFHDPTLERMTGRPGRISDLRWADLQTVRIGGAAAVPHVATSLGMQGVARLWLASRAGRRLRLPPGPRRRLPLRPVRAPPRAAGPCVDGRRARADAPLT